MIQKKLTKLVGLKKEEFDQFVESGQIKAQPARLIPVLKTGDEMALTSIFLATIKLVKEYRDGIFRELKLGRSGKSYYFTEVTFPEIAKSRVDGLIIIVLKGVISDAVFFEMKSKNNGIEPLQIEQYIELAKKLRVTKLVTVSNEFVADPTHSPINIRVPKAITMLHFSWTYLMTMGQLLLFRNELSIEDEDQVQIMREVLFYLENPLSGTCGYTMMKPGWKELSEKIRAQTPLRMTDDFIEDAVLSWYEEEKDMALLLSRKLGVFVKSASKTKDSLKNDIKRLVKENYILGSLSVKNSVSDIRIKAEFERRIMEMSVRILPPLNKGTIGRISWIDRQIDSCKRKSEEVFCKLESEIWVEANVKYARENLKVKLIDIEALNEMAKGKEIQAFRVSLIRPFGANFASTKKFIQLADKMVLEFYEGIVQHMTNWNRPAPKISHD